MEFYVYFLINHFLILQKIKHVISLISWNFMYTKFLMLLVSQPSSFLKFLPLEFLIKKSVFGPKKFQNFLYYTFYRIPPHCGACTYIRNRPIFQSENLAIYVYKCTLPVSYIAACTYIRSSMKIFSVACTIKWNHFRLKYGRFRQKVLKNHEFWPFWTSNYLLFSKFYIRAPPPMVENSPL